MRWFAPAVAAAFASLLPLAGLALAVYVDEHVRGPFFLPGGTPDYAPVRAVGVVLILAPFLFVLSAMYFALIAWFLQKRGSYSLTGLLVLAIPLPLVVIAAASLQDPNEALQPVAIVAGLSILSVSCGSVAWWSVAHRTAGPTRRRE